MRGSLLPSLLGLTFFVGWSLLVGARERIAQRLGGQPLAPRTTPAARPLRQLASERLRWN